MGHGKSGKKASLKSTLQSQQTRLKNKQKAAHAAEVTEQKGKQKQQRNSKKRPTIPFKPTDKILLIGEGNFSFARALLVDPPSSLEHLVPRNITATAYDSEEECYAKYPEAKEIVETLRDKGVETLFGIDATKLEKIPTFKGKLWDRIVWNFPHSGKGITDQDRNILSHQILISDFFRSAAKFLAIGPMPVISAGHKRKRKADDDDEDEEDVKVSEDEMMFSDDETSTPATGARGTVLITLRNVEPYVKWDVPRLAKNPPKGGVAGASPPRYTIFRSFVFQRKLWKGYEHRMTKGERVNGQGTTGQGGEDRTWEFCLRDQS
ncbi:hypothetical protein SERLA73DRAFT_174370 [Serpula lacrymans var. lacrymans S7.3]|uniref:25S rRNA (uridine-N(3))-methyltransferase BMT5-like domain-containing protein n=2 Tax=Serpula lacrymans var. lacrymans TaxID=341189 RepID=F8PFK1_SERL3|nr:uncharacterized protein SERLADRAFT_455866 [Serpula lacrymans var. lacrymans S7.9]EGO05290.1 hypothetical protein SERLA73DRAFT_174370 [Serpula lacrymans var. lacrymans S7.3]EGO31148.1 hypothetical protein SERLADRAFT_455866 [Serpula lacrymans var. lacrymans S7.9]